MTNLIKFESIDQIKELCSIIAKSGLHKNETPEQAFTKMMYGLELGLLPMAARNAVFVVNGRPSLSSNAMATALDRHPEYDYIVNTLTREVCVIYFYKKRDGDWIERGVMEFDIEDAKRADLIKAGSPWIKYPKAMLFARAISQGIRCFAPGCFSMPVYTKEELGVIDAEEIKDNPYYTGVPDVETKAAPRKLPFKTIDEAVKWAADMLDMDLDDTRAILENTNPDEEGNVAHNFYDKVIALSEDR